MNSAGRVSVGHNLAIPRQCVDQRNHSLGDPQTSPPAQVPSRSGPRVRAGQPCTSGTSPSSCFLAWPYWCRSSMRGASRSGKHGTVRCWVDWAGGRGRERQQRQISPRRLRLALTARLAQVPPHIGRCERGEHHCGAPRVAQPRGGGWWGRGGVAALRCTAPHGSKQEACVWLPCVRGARVFGVLEGVRDAVATPQAASCGPGDRRLVHLTHKHTCLCCPAGRPER